MVEMLETAEILKHATPKSLVSSFFFSLIFTIRVKQGLTLSIAFTFLFVGDYGRGGTRHHGRRWFGDRIFDGSPPQLRRAV